jgi:hypothetical protein
MSSNTAAKNLHARNTLAILGTVRTVGMIIFGVLIAITALGTLIVTFSEESVAGLGGGLLGLAIEGIFAALWYASASWWIETLNMLMQIAKNTATN